MTFFWICVVLLGLGLGTVLSGQARDLAECKSQLRIAELDRKYLDARLRSLETIQAKLIECTVENNKRQFRVIDLEKRRV